METGPNFSIQNAGSLTNQVSGIMLSTSCNISEYDHQSTCVSEALIQNTIGGFVSIFASSRYGFGFSDSIKKMGPSYQYNAAFIKYLFDDSPELKWHSFGTIAALAKQDFCGSTTSPYPFLQYAICPIGDPEMPVYTESPKVFENVNIYNSGHYVTVNTGGIEDCRICITSQDIGKGFQEVVEDVSIHTFDHVVGDFRVTITAPNYIPYQYPEITGMEIELDTYFSIFPNPAFDLITIVVPRRECFSVNITSLNGRSLFSTDSMESTLKVDLTSLPEGIYFVTVRTREFVRTEKIVKL